MSVRLGFMMAQVAGHITNYRNLRRVAETDPTIDATWYEIAYYRPGGRIEQLADRLNRGMALRPLLEVAQGLRGCDVDAFLVNTGIAEVFRRRFAKTPTIIDFDITPVQLRAMPAYGHSSDRQFIEQYRHRVKSRFWTTVAGMNAWSEWAKASAVNDYGVDADLVTVNPPGVDLDYWRPAADGPSTNAPQRILFVGADFRRKGGDLLLDWYTRASPDDVELHVVTRERVRQVPGVTVYSDMQPNSPELVQLYQNSDVFVLPTRAEAFGIATVEAMAVGLPVVMSDIGAAKEIVAQGRNGFLISPESGEELGDAISTILGDESMRSRMSQASRRCAETKFDLETNAHRTLSMLKDLALAG